MDTTMTKTKRALVKLVSSAVVLEVAWQLYAEAGGFGRVVVVAIGTYLLATVWAFDSCSQSSEERDS
jgi:hypothetical protein